MRIAAETGLPLRAVEATAHFSEGATVPFIARYRKEATGSLDEVAITTIRDRFRLNSNPGERPSSNLWENVSYSVMASASRLCILRPWWLWKIVCSFRPRRRTRATMAKKKVLSPWPNGCEIPGCISSGARGSGSGLSGSIRGRRQGSAGSGSRPGRC